MELKDMTVRDLEDQYYKGRWDKCDQFNCLMREWAIAKVKDIREHMHCRIMCGKDKCCCNDAVIAFLVMNFNLTEKDVDG